MPKQNIVLNNWIGGENRGVEEHVQPNELSRMYGFTHTDGTLRSSKGVTPFVTDSTNVDYAYINNYQYYKWLSPSGTRYDIRQSNGMIIFDTGAAQNRWRPIYGSYVASQAGLTSFQPFGERLFFSDYWSGIGKHPTPTSLRNMAWWDGFYYATGTVTCAAGTTVTGVGTANFPGVRCGDRLYIFDAVSSPWHGPYIVKDINQIITIANGDGADTFTVTYGGETSDPVAYNVSAADLQTELGTVTTIGTHTNYAGATVPNVAVTGSAGGPYTIRFIGSKFQSDSLTAVTATGTGCTATMSYTLTIDTNGPTETSQDYMIARTHLAGLRAPAGLEDVSIAAAASGSFATAGTYGFASTWKNKTTGARSNPTYHTSAAGVYGVAVDVGQKVVVYDPNMYTAGSGAQGDIWEIWRETTAGSGVYYLVKEVYRDQVGYATPDTVDVTGAETPGTEPLTANRDQPPIGGKLFAWNGYLWTYHVERINTGDNAWTTGNYYNRLYWSAYNNPEYWDDGLEYGVISPADLSDPYTGGMLQLKDAGNPIMELAVEGGVSGEALYTNLLIMTRYGPFHRFAGYNHDSWMFNSGAVSSDCTSAQCAVSNADLIGWWSSNGPCVKANSASTNEVIPIYRKLFPQETRAFAEVSPRYQSSVSGVRYRDTFVWAHTEDGSYNTSLVFYHIPSGTWFTDSASGSGLSQNRSIHTLSTAIGNTAASYYEREYLYICDTNGIWIYDLPVSSATHFNGVSGGFKCLAKTGFITVGDPYTPEKIIDLEFCFNKPVTQQTVTVTVYDAETGAALKTADTLTLAAGANTGRHVKQIKLGGVRARAFQIEISGTFTAQVVCYWIRATVTRGGQE
jgi:hypothetical protein